MYNQTHWKDHVTEFPQRRKITDAGGGLSDVAKAQGEIIQQGTPQSATNFNNMEDGIQDASIAAAVLGFANLHQQRTNDAHHAATDAEILGETKTITLKNTAKFPFNTSADNPTTVNLTKTRNNLFYTVEAVVTEHAGPVGDIHITDKQLNGFKVSYDGSGSSVTITLRIKGGMA